jgi:hypothetical protein
MDTVANKQTPNRDFLFPNEVSVTSFFLTSGVWGVFFSWIEGCNFLWRDSSTLGGKCGGSFWLISRFQRSKIEEVERFRSRDLELYEHQQHRTGFIVTKTKGWLFTYHTSLCDSLCSNCQIKQQNDWRCQYLIALPRLHANNLPPHQACIHQIVPSQHFYSSVVDIQTLAGLPICCRGSNCRHFHIGKQPSMLFQSYPWAFLHISSMNSVVAIALQHCTKVTSSSCRFLWAAVSWPECERGIISGACLQ